MPIETLYRGTFVLPRTFDALEWKLDHVLGVTSEGTIGFLVPAADLPAAEQTFGFRAATIPNVVLTPSQLIMPGFVDTHAHAPQYVFAGRGLDMQLLEWLETYTFPTEAQFGDLDFARTVYEAVVDRTLRNGTTTISYFATIHRPASVELARICKRRGQRALVGKVNMDRNSPANYVETTAESLAETEAFIRDVRALGSPLVRPIITPRFVPTCTAELMAGLGAMAARLGVHVQSHISENQQEIEWVHALHPEAANYADVYRAAGLLTPRTVMAHGVHLTGPELDMLAAHHCGLAHCANSNVSLVSGHFHARAALAAGVHVGLGTDIAGGYSPSMLDAVRGALFAAKTTAMTLPGAGISLPNAVFLATLGGAQALALDAETGSLDAGKAFDALVVDLQAADSAFDLFGAELTPAGLEGAFAKFMMLGDDRSLAAVYVQGRLVAGPAPPMPPRTDSDAACEQGASRWLWLTAAVAAAAAIGAVVAAVSMRRVK